MHIVITGAGGFVGAALARRIVEQGLPGCPVPTKLTLVDRQLDNPPLDERVRVIAGDFGWPEVLDAMFDKHIDILFHLASVPGGQAERDFSLGYRVNLLSPLALFEQVAGQGGPVAPRVVFASSIAVYGSELPGQIDAATSARPALSYGAHKLVGEIVLADLSRRGMVDGVSLRLPGIVARPGLSAGHGSAFMSAIMRAAESGVAYDCPVSPQSSCWWMSLQSCVDNLVHAAAGLDSQTLDAERVVTLPVLHLPVDAIMQALARRFGDKATAGIQFRPDHAIEQLFGQMPPMDSDAAWQLGFRHDGDVDQLIARALSR
jgi:nucleoside-diphosphate-sugar epimerase